MMFGDKFKDIGDSCLISNWGWSMYLSSFGDVDPNNVVPELLTVKPGVPSRDGERRTKVVDGPHDLTVVNNIKVNENGEEIRMPRSEMHVKRQNDMVGTREDHFVVTVRFSDKDIYLTSGYREMHRVLWNSSVSKRCKHSPNRPTELPFTTATVWQVGENKLLSRTVVVRTEGKGVARWMTILTGDHSEREGMIVKNGCLECTLSQTYPHEGKWVIVC
jgi:hypothetical protein